MPDVESKPKPLISRRLRRWQDVRGFTNESAAGWFAIPLRTYTNVLYAEHSPRGGARALFERLLHAEEKRLKLPPIT